MNAAGLVQNVKIILKKYSLFRKWSYIAETSHIQEHTVNKHIFFLETVMTWHDNRIKSNDILCVYCK